MIQEITLSGVINRFTQHYLARYFQLQPEDQEQLEEWWPIVCAVRLIDGIPEIQDWLLEQIRIGF